MYDPRLRTQMKRRCRWPPVTGGKTSAMLGRSCTPVLLRTRRISGVSRILNVSSAGKVGTLSSDILGVCKQVMRSCKIRLDYISGFTR